MNARALAVVALAAVAAASACKRRGPEEKRVSQPAEPQSWSAYKNGKEVLRFKKGPGTLGSRGELPAGAKPPQHPWLDAQPLDPNEEDALRSILDASSNFDDFVARLKAAGYDVRPEEGR